MDKAGIDLRLATASKIKGGTEREKKLCLIIDAAFRNQSQRSKIDRAQ